MSAWTKDPTSTSCYSRGLRHSILTSRYSTSYYRYFSDEETYAQRTLRNVSTARDKDQIPCPSEPDLSSEALGPTAPAVFWVSPESKCPVAPFSQHWNSKTASSGNPTGTNQEQAKHTACRYAGTWASRAPPSVQLHPGQSPAPSSAPRTAATPRPQGPHPRPGTGSDRVRRHMSWRTSSRMAAEPRRRL